MTTVEKQLISLQQQLEHLNAEVATLLALSASESLRTNSGSSFSNQPTGMASTHSVKTPVGIQRYRQLMAND